jgi:hypothetical protein
VEDVEQIKQVTKKFYKQLLGTDQRIFNESKADRIRQLILLTIPVEKASLLEKKITEEEIRRTLFSMKANKAPSPDGFSANFFKAAWSMVGSDVVVAIKGFFFLSGLLLKEVNATIITLIPKMINPSSMGDFRPIACCNVIYKCITKIIANRMLPLLGDLVSMNQSAFIPNRSISENVLLAQEIVKNYHKEIGKPKCANWEFMIHYLHCFEFPMKFLN